MSYADKLKQEAVAATQLQQKVSEQQRKLSAKDTVLHDTNAQNVELTARLGDYRKHLSNKDIEIKLAQDSSRATMNELSLAREQLTRLSNDNLYLSMQSKQLSNELTIQNQRSSLLSEQLLIEQGKVDQLTKEQNDKTDALNTQNIDRYTTDTNDICLTSNKEPHAAFD